MEGDLLSERDLREILSFRELSIAVTYLKKTIYGNYFFEDTGESLIYKIDAALRTSLADSMQKILSLFKGYNGTLVKVLLGRWDVFNIKTLIRGKLNNVHAEEVLSATVPAGSLDEGMLNELYKQPSVQEMLDMFFTIGYSYVLPLIKVRNLYGGNLFKGEVELEKSFFADALRRLKSSKETGLNKAIVGDTLKILIDRYNLIAAIKMAEGGLHLDEAVTYFIEGGSRVSLSIYKKIIKGRDIDECISMIGSTAWKTDWESFSARSRISSSTLLAERWMDYKILTGAVRTPREDPLNIGLIISYIWRKVNEVINLRTILRGIHYNIPQSEIEGLLIIA